LPSSVERLVAAVGQSFRQKHYRFLKTFIGAPRDRLVIGLPFPNEE
jgi:hypothetical protein